jgi:hypothetical protein
MQSTRRVPYGAVALLALGVVRCAEGYGDWDAGDAAEDSVSGEDTATADVRDDRGGPVDVVEDEGGADVDGAEGVDAPPLPDGCVPASCESLGIACGPADDGCGRTTDCGGCDPGLTCDGGLCVPVCTPTCGGRECGDDGCGGSCGSCLDGRTCDGDGRCVDGCTPACTGRECGGDGCGGSCGSCPSGQTCTATGMCVCDPAVEVVFYTQDAWNVLADPLAADPSPCAHYYFSIPATGAAGAKLDPRPGEAGRMHDRGPRFHALAEFHWGSWTDVAGLTPYEKGVDFRRRMAAAGYDVSANDGWAFQEVFSNVRTDPASRTTYLEVLRGLHDGPPGSPPFKGAVFVIGMAHGTMTLGTYKSRVAEWLVDAPFWTSVNNHVAWWAQEVYADPYFSCMPLASVAERSTQVNEFVEHFARLAAAGPAEANTAQSYLGRAYVPLMNAVYNSSGSGYGDTMIGLEAMKHFVSLQVYAARAWSGSHPYPDGRLGFAWARQAGVADAELTELAQRLAAAIHYAYDAGGGSAAHACSPSGAYTWCQCSVPGAVNNDGWETFGTW